MEVTCQTLGVQDADVAIPARSEVEGIQNVTRAASLELYLKALSSTMGLPAHDAG